MQNVEIASVMIGVVAGAGTMVMLYAATRLSRAWRERGRVAASLAAGRARGAAGSLERHIATEWTDGRLRLNALLAVMKALAASLAQEMAKLNHLDPSDPLDGREARQMVSPALRGVTFDEHLRNECRMLIPLLQFCGRDLAESQGANTAAQLAALAEIEAALQSVDRG